MLRKSLLFLLLWVVPALAAKPLKIHEVTDPFDKERIISTESIVFRHAHFDSDRSGYFAIVLQRSQRPEASPRFHIQVFCGPKKGHQMNILPGQTLNVWIDGKSASYYSQGSDATHTALGARRVAQPHALYEDIPISDLEDMTHAKKIQMQVKGDRDALIADLDSSGQQILQEFVSAYVHSTPAE